MHMLPSVSSKADPCAGRRPEAARACHAAGPYAAALSIAWDILMRAVGMSWAGWVIVGQASQILRMVSAPPDPVTAVFVAALAARITTLLFMSLLMVFFVIRHRPLRKAAGLLPRAVALAGTLLPMSVVFLPRDDQSVAVNVASFALATAGFALAAYAFAFLSRSASIMPEARALVTDGPYRFMRHPVYVFEQIGILGVFLPYLSPTAALLLILHIGFQFQRALNEERVLRSAFPEYDAYARRTARLIPGLY